MNLCTLSSLGKVYTVYDSLLTQYTIFKTLILPFFAFVYMQYIQDMYGIPCTCIIHTWNLLIPNFMLYVL